MRWSAVEKVDVVEMVYSSFFGVLLVLEEEDANGYLERGGGSRLLQTQQPLAPVPGRSLLCVGIARNGEAIDEMVEMSRGLVQLQRGIGQRQCAVVQRW